MLGDFNGYDAAHMAARAQHAALPGKYDKEVQTKCGEWTASGNEGLHQMPWEDPDAVVHRRRRPDMAGFEEVSDHPQPAYGKILPPAEHWKSNKPPTGMEGRVTRLHAQNTHAGARLFIH